MWATIGPDSGGGVILSGHTDVVPVDGQDWSSDPFVLREADGRLYGRGTCDMKGFLASCLAAVPQMTQARLRRPVHLALSYDEEVGCTGVKRLLDVRRGDVARPRYCVVGEPTSMGVVIAHKAKRSMQITVHGRPCHSSRAPEGVNAVDYAAMIVLKLREIGRRLAADGPFDEAYDVVHSTAHTGIMTGGTALNIVPERCDIVCEFRVLPTEDADALVAELRDFITGQIEPQMRAVAPETGVDFHVAAGFPGTQTEPDAEIVALAKRFSGASGHSKVAYGTEGGLFQEALGVETVICGPGDIAQAHRPDEYVEISQLQACDRFIGRLVDWAATDDA